MPIVVDSVQAAYESRTVLFDISCTINRGECLGIFGHNGAGKSTLLRVLAGSVPARAGEIRVSTADQMPAQPVIRLVPQEEMVFEHLSVRENLVIGLWNDQIGWRESAKRIDAVCAFLPAIAAILRRRGGALSGGERRQVALGRALLADPDVLLVDEPSLGLSPVATDLVMVKLDELRQAGKTIVIVEQNLPVALEIVERYYVLRQGQITTEATVSADQPIPLEKLYELI